MKKLTWACLSALLIMPMTGNASSYTGTITALRYGDGTDVPTARIGVEVAEHNSPCPAHPTFFSLESSNVEVINLWTSALLAAQTAGQTVAITGTGVCDGHGVEGLAWFDINKPKKPR